MADHLPNLSATEADAAHQVLDILSALDAGQIQRVLAHVQANVDAHANEAPAFARGIAGPLGKLNCEIKARIDEHTHTLFLQQCAMRGTDASSAVRDCVYALVHGKTYQQMVVEKINHDAKRIDALKKLIGPLCATEFSGDHG